MSHISGLYQTSHTEFTGFYDCLSLIMALACSIIVVLNSKVSPPLRVSDTFKRKGTISITNLV